MTNKNEGRIFLYFIHHLIEFWNTFQNQFYFYHLIFSNFFYYRTSFHNSKSAKKTNGPSECYSKNNKDVPILHTMVVNFNSTFKNLSFPPLIILFWFYVTWFLSNCSYKPIVENKTKYFWKYYASRNNTSL